MGATKPGVVQPTPAAAAPAPAPAPAPAQAPAIPAGMGAGGFANKIEALNMVRIKDHQAKNPKGCGFAEVAPNVWIKIDCHEYKPAVKAIAHLSSRKAKMAAAKTMTVKPLRLARLKPRAAPTVQNGERAGTEKGGPEQVGESLPGTVDHRAENLEGPIKDQGPVGSCTAFSLSATLDNAAIRAGKMTAGNRDQAASPNHVWSGYGIPQMGTAADANLGRSIGTMAIWPQDNKEACKLADAFYEQECGFETNVIPGSWRSDKTIVGKYDKSNASPSYKINVIERLQTQPPNMDELLTSLASGSSLWIAMKIDGSAWSNRSMKSAVIPDWSTPSGGHAVEMAGYRDSPSGRQFLIHNSWGTSWGDGGYAWVSEKMVQKYMHYAYKVKIEGGVKKEDLTDDDCSPEELLDLTTGLCGLMCGDERPNNGCPTGVRKAGGTQQ